MPPNKTSRGKRKSEGFEGGVCKLYEDDEKVKGKEGARRSIRREEVGERALVD